MKAAVVYKKGEGPVYADFPEPVVQNDDELLLVMKASAVKHIDRSRAAGTHYSDKAAGEQSKVIGGDGVGLLENGERVYAIGVSGMIAEKAVIDKGRMIRVPFGLDSITAAALPNAVMGSAMALRFRAGLKEGDTVLINGATGFTGKIAVQLAKHYGAKRIIATGRNEQSLQSLVSLGADELISLKKDDKTWVSQLKNIHHNTPVDIIIDYLWGQSAELILSCLKGSGAFTHKTRFVSVGAVTGDLIQLSAANLRSVDLMLSGSGMGSWTKEDIAGFFSDILPSAFALATQNKLKVDTISVPLPEVDQLWNMNIPAGKRLVVTI